MQWFPENHELESHVCHCFWGLLTSQTLQGPVTRQGKVGKSQPPKEPTWVEVLVTRLLVLECIKTTCLSYIISFQRYSKWKCNSNDKHGYQEETGSARHTLREKPSPWIIKILTRLYEVYVINIDASIKLQGGALQHLHTMLISKHNNLFVRNNDITEGIDG